MDNHSKKLRSYNMSKIRSKNTKLEETVRKYLFQKGFRYLKNVKSLLGNPDIVMPKYKTFIFLNGCFWHAHENCSKFVWSASNTVYWEKKLLTNKQRDKTNIKVLESYCHMGV